MKSANILIYILVTTGTFLLLTQFSFANDLDSTNYKVVGATTNAGGGIGNSANYSLLNSIGKISANPRNYSTNYRLNQDPSENFVAAQPSVQCFETTTDGTTSCTSGPTELINGGMVAICGTGGCYNQARFEIQNNTNPSDTLYSVEISTDNFSSDTKYIDGATFLPETSTTHDINDFRTESYWETETFNVKGLLANTIYYIRISALHGDFTQSDYSSSSTATTAQGFLSFDIDIANTGSCYTTETSSPYSVSFSGSDDLVAGAAPTVAPTQICLNFESNSIGGVSIIEYGKNGGLYSPTTTQTISSGNTNLDSVTEGFGLQGDTVEYDHAFDSVTIAADFTTNYKQTLNTVGAISTSANKIIYTQGPVVDGWASMYLKARAGTSKTPASDYSEEIYFTLVPLY